MKMPALFISHGSPLIAVENDAFTYAIETAGRKIVAPRAVVVVSAHWEEDLPIRVNANPKPDLIYDFGGFPDELFNKKYPCPGDRVLANIIAAIFQKKGLKAELEEKRGLDHGVWTPLVRLFPKADVPVVEVSLPKPRTPQDVFEMGRALAPLRDEGVVLLGTGGIVHNLRLVRMGAKESPVDEFAGDFDEWFKTCLAQTHINPLFDYRDQGPRADLAVQGPEHFEPVFFTIGAGLAEPLQFIYEGFHYGNLSMRSFQLG